MYYGPLGLDFVFHLFFLSVTSATMRRVLKSDRSMRYSKMLEENTYHGHRAEYAWLLVVCCSLLLVRDSTSSKTSADTSAQLLSPLSPAPFLSGPLSFTLVYLWSRTNASVRLSLFGVITITAGYLPYALCLFSWALSSGHNGVIGDLLGIAVGHVWFAAAP